VVLCFFTIEGTFGNLGLYVTTKITLSLGFCVAFFKVAFYLVIKRFQWLHLQHFYCISWKITWIWVWSVFIWVCFCHYKSWLIWALEKKICF
jgi:hypothetical protein